MLKIVKLFSVIAIPLFLTSCVSMLSVVKNELSDEDIKTSYNSKTIEAFEYPQGGYEYTIREYKRGIQEDKELADAEKKILLNRLKEFEVYEPGRYYGLIMQGRNLSVVDEPILRSNLNLQFTITSAKTAPNSTLIQDVILFPQKLLWVMKVQGVISTSIDYNYWWVIKTKHPIDKKHIADSDRPVNLIVTYPNGKTQVYSILKK